MNSGVNRLFSRSFPPPMVSFCAYSFSLQHTGRSKCLKVALKAGRCPSRSVSARTPSQSKIKAGMV